MKYERLTKWEEKGIASVNGCSLIDKDFAEAINRLAELEDKIENGTLVELPCKVGDMVYYTWLCESVSASRIEVIKIRENTITFDTASGNTFLLEHIGQTVFLTKAEAEKRLEELRGEV